MPHFDAALMWFRRDLRCEDNAALFAALKDSRRVYCAFVYDTEILEVLPRRNDRRVEFICESVNELGDALEQAGGQLITLHGAARTEIPQLAAKLGVQAVYSNHDYEPAALKRDHAVAKALKDSNITFLPHRMQLE